MFAEVETLKKSIDNSVTMFLIGIVMIFAYSYEALSPAIRTLTLLFGVFLSSFAVFIMLYKEGVGVSRVCTLLEMLLYLGIPYLIITNIYVAGCLAINDSIIILPHSLFLSLATLMLWLIAAIGVLIVIIGLKEMLTYRQR